MTDTAAPLPTPQDEGLVASLARAQKAMGNADKNAANDGFKRGGKPATYADLSSVRDAVIPALANEGIACVQPFDLREGGWVVVTRLMKGEETIESICPILGDTNKSHAFGSGVTYARRYSLAAIAGIAQDDDDGNAADAAPPRSRPAAQQTDGTRRQPPEAPEVEIVPPPAKPKNGPRTWAGWVEKVGARIDACPDIDALNGVLKAHNAVFGTLEDEAPDSLDLIKQKTAERRDVLTAPPARAPGQEG